MNISICGKGGMCLSTVFIEKGVLQEEFMQDISGIEADGKGFSLFNPAAEKIMGDNREEAVSGNTVSLYFSCRRQLTSVR